MTPDAQASLADAVNEHRTLSFPPLSDSRRECPECGDPATLLSTRTLPYAGPVVPDDATTCDHRTGVYVHTDRDD